MGENSESSFIELESNIQLTTVRGWISYSATPDRRDFRNAGLLGTMGYTFFRSLFISLEGK